jgi:hypothetical protein
MDMLSILVKAWPTGEQKSVAATRQNIIHHYYILSFFHASAGRYHANVVPIVDGLCRNPFPVDAPLSTLLHEFQNAIRDGLVKDGIVGPHFETGLLVLPLQDMPNLADLQNMDLASLHKQAFRLSQLPNEPASEFFHMKSFKLNVVHFLVWLPPPDGAFHWLNLSNN